MAEQQSPASPSKPRHHTYMPGASPPRASQPAQAPNLKRFRLFSGVCPRTSSDGGMQSQTMKQGGDFWLSSPHRWPVTLPGQACRCRAAGLQVHWSACNPTAGCVHAEAADTGQDERCQPDFGDSEGAFSSQSCLHTQAQVWEQTFQMNELLNTLLSCPLRAKTCIQMLLCCSI